MVQRVYLAKAVYWMTTSSLNNLLHFRCRCSFTNQNTSEVESTTRFSLWTQFPWVQKCCFGISNQMHQYVTFPYPCLVRALLSMAAHRDIALIQAGMQSETQAVVQFWQSKGTTLPKCACYFDVARPSRSFDASDHLNVESIVVQAKHDGLKCRVGNSVHR
jgi:hypothetical protein